MFSGVFERKHFLLRGGPGTLPRPRTVVVTPALLYGVIGVGE